MPKINIQVDPEVFLPVYQDTLESTNDIEFLYGSRDSGKSRHIAQTLVLKCLSNKHFKCPLIRKVVNTVKDSQWAMIKEVVGEWGLDHLFKFTISPLEIKCHSGGVFLARGMDDPKKIKSLTNPSDAWIEEGADLETDDWTVITTSLRSNNSRVQIWFCFNPDVEGLYQEHWLYQQFFSHTADLSFTSTKEVTLMDGSRTSLTYRATHSTFYDNPYCPPERRAIYEELIKTSEYYYMVYAKGLWGTKQTGGEFYRSFKVDKHVQNVTVDTAQQIHISIDNNVFPYVAVQGWQLIKAEKGWIARQVVELPGIDPDNTASRAAKGVVGWLHRIGYNGTVKLYGDRSTKSRNTIDDNKRSFFSIFQETISAGGYRTEDKMLNFAPAPHAIADFINAIFDGLIPGIEIQIGKNCTLSIGDYVQTKVDPKDGNMLKVRVPHPTIEGATYEKTGHLSDTFKDLIVSAFHDEFVNYTNRHKAIRPGGISTVSRMPNITL